LNRILRALLGIFLPEARRMQPFAGTERGIDRAWSRDRISRKTHGGRGRESVWKLSIQWGIAVREDPKDAKAEGPAVTTLRPEGYAVTLHLFLSDAVTLADVAVPANVEVKSGGEIEHFVAQHKGSQGPAKS